MSSRMSSEEVDTRLKIPVHKIKEIHQIYQDIMHKGMQVQVAGVI